MTVSIAPPPMSSLNGANDAAVGSAPVDATAKAAGWALAANSAAVSDADISVVSSAEWTGSAGVCRGATKTRFTLKISTGAACSCAGAGSCGRGAAAAIRCSAGCCGRAAGIGLAISAAANFGASTRFGRSAICGGAFSFERSIGCGLRVLDVDARAKARVRSVRISALREAALDPPKTAPTTWRSPRRTDETRLNPLIRV